MEVLHCIDSICTVDIYFLIGVCDFFSWYNIPDIEGITDGQWPVTIFKGYIS